MRSFNTHQRKFLRLPLVERVALWNRARALTPTRRTKAPPLPGTLRADFRHLREGLLRATPPVDIYRLPGVRDMRDHYDQLSRQRESDAATPLNAEQLSVCLRTAPPTIAIVLLLMATGSVRHAEIGRPSTKLTEDLLHRRYVITRLPKRGRELRAATVPMMESTKRIIDRVTSPQGTVRVSPLRVVNAFIKSIAKRYGWASGRYSTYSIRHGVLTAALQAGATPDDIRTQTAHQRSIPQTYLRRHNAYATQQSLTANALLLPASRMPVPGSDEDSDKR